MAAEQAMGWSYRVASSRGVNGRLTEDDRDVMAKAGLAEAEIAGVGDCLDAMRKSGALVPSQARIREIVEEIGALPTPGNVARAEPIYLRALGEALMRSATVSSRTRCHTGTSWRTSVRKHAKTNRNGLLPNQLSPWQT